MPLFNKLSSLRPGAALLACALLLLMPLTAHAAARNVVLIVADDLGMQLGCYGDRVARTPALDRLAAAGTRFTRAYCTTASCSASRSVILTGLYSHATGHYGHSHGDGHFSTFDSVRTLPVLLSESGYRTCSIGKYHVAPDYVYKFDAYRNDGTAGARNSVQMAKNAAEWIAEKDARPFFLYFCPADPHRGGGPGGFANFNGEADRYQGVTPVTFDPAKVPVPSWLPDQPEVRKELAEFYQAISRMDQGIGQLLDALQATGHWEDTLVIFCSDNGPPFPGAKTTLYQPGANLPLIVRNPAVKPGVTDARVTWADLVPSVLDYCGASPPPGPPVRKLESINRRVTEGRAVPYANHGRSFLEALREEHPAGRDEVYLSHTFHEVTMYYPMRGVVSGRFKYLFNIAHELPYPFASDLYDSPTWQASLKRKDTQYGRRTVNAYVHRPRHELYDLEADPDELRNLAGEPAHQERLQSLQNKVKVWQKQTTDPWVSKWEYE